jgi:RimJ/RimL family protein N-acetyltransferase
MSRYATPFGSYHIEPMTSQPNVALCHGFFIHHTMRGRRLAHALKAHQNAQLRSEGYNYAVCTCDGANVAQHAVLAAAGWVKTGEFTSSKTGGLVLVYGWTV